jgi:RNA polymerase sigma factor (TIGR02999 family)
MAAPSPGEITGLLKRWSDGDRSALDELMPIVHQELRRLAQSYFRNERTDHTLQATALVNEAFLRLIQGGPIENRSHFFAVSARAMRQILIDHARQKRAAKRGGGDVALAFDEAKGTPGPDPVDVLELDILLKRLAELDPRQAEVVEVRYFAGLSVEETAEVLGTSTATVKRDWNLAKAWLRRELLRDFR